MYSLCFVLTLYVYGVLGELKDVNDWQYDVGIPSTSQGGGDSKCKKDLLLIVDTSYSVGKGHFDGNVKPFLKNLVTDPRLNVGQDGTQVGLVLFSSADKTKVKLDIGAKKDAQELEQYMESLKWEDISGDRTRTELALELANEMFKKNSPKNKRSDIDDVIVLITDGEPRGKRNTLKLTKRYAKELKDKKVLLVTAAVGPMSEQSQFEELLKELATSSEYFLKAKFDNMDQILGTLVAKSCIKPGECACNEIISSPIQIKPGQSKAMIHWVKPDFTCATGGKVKIENTIVQPPVTSPHAFPVGKHIINYTYNLKGDVTVTCSVTINVKGELCRGKAFHSGQQECCCGTIHRRRSGYNCCGPDYYNTNVKQCCKNANLISRKETCPGN